MNALDLLNRIRPGWIIRQTNALARGAVVRTSLEEQLERFYESMLQGVITGDPAWLNPVLTSWGRAVPESDLDYQQASMMPVISKILNTSQEYIQETLTPEESALLMTALLPLFTHAFERTADQELQARVKSVADELGTARAKLEQLDKTKSDFTSVAAHELKTPLTLIEGYAMMIRELYPKNDEASHGVLLLKGIDNGTRRLREIVDDMIDVSLIDNKMLSLNFQPLWVGRLLQGIKNDLKEDLTRRKQTLVIEDFPGSKDMTFGDPERLHQAFRNLLTNAVKYTPDEGQIILNGRKLPGFTEITFKDTGIGIDPADHDRIFEKFGQLGNVSLHSSGKTKFKGGGPGLGLPITKGIIEAHGGTIWVESEGCDEASCPGSVFHVMLPQREDAPDNKIARFFSSLVDKL